MCMIVTQDPLKIIAFHKYLWSRFLWPQNPNVLIPQSRQTECIWKELEQGGQMSS